MIILGTGGHSKVVISTAIISGEVIEAVYDDSKQGTSFFGYTVLGKIENSIVGVGIIAIGKNEVRKDISEKLDKVDYKSVIHPSAIIAKDVKVGEGSVIMAGAIIQPGTVIGSHCIVNTGACIDHDCKIGDYSHIGPNCSMAGGVQVGVGAFVGIGSSIKQYIQIGDWTSLGAGSVVIKDIPSHCTAVGVPAKPVKFHSE